MSGTPTTPVTPDDFADEALLVEGLQQGDDRAFEALIRNHGPRMFATARRILGNEADANDALQDAFSSVFRAIGQFQGDSKLSTWLHRVAANAALAKLRKQARRNERRIEDLLPVFQQDGHLARSAAPWATDGLEGMLARETRSRIRQKILELPDDYRDVLMLRDIEQLDTASAAAALEISEGAVKTRLHRARQALRTLLEPEFGT